MRKRVLYALLVALFLVGTMSSGAFAQTRDDKVVATRDLQAEPVRVVSSSGTVTEGRFFVVDDFVLVCPSYEVLDQDHPCAESNRSGAVRFNAADDYTLVCPTKEVLNPEHPCAQRASQISRAGADAFVLVCPNYEVLDPSHPCAETNTSKLSRWSAAGDYVLVCPVKEVLDPRHPCFDR